MQLSIVTIKMLNTKVNIDREISNIVKEHNKLKMPDIYYIKNLYGGVVIPEAMYFKVKQQIKFVETKSNNIVYITLDTKDLAKIWNAIK